MNELAFVILAYSRPARLRMLIDSIHKFVEKPKILVYIDIAPFDSPLGESAAQSQVISECVDCVNSGLIEDYKISESNQGTKASYFASFTWGFLSFENIVLLEDDMIFIEDPSQFIGTSIEVFESDKSVGMAVLFANFNHFPNPNSMQITNWPIMWGVLLNRQKYSSICNYLAGSDVNNVKDVVSRFTSQELKGYLQQFFKGRFELTWRFKYSRALESRTAWDTQWQFALWGLCLKTLVPACSLIADLGIDQFSVSTSRMKIEPNDCQSIFRHYIGTNHYCRACEIFREVENFSLPAVLRRNRATNFMLLRGLL